MPALRLILALAVAAAVSGCQWLRRPVRKPPPPTAAVEPLAPSPRLIIGRVLATDPDRQFAFVELGADVPATNLTEGIELIARAFDLRVTGRLQTSRYLRGRTLGTVILSGQPTPGDEVVWLAP